MEILDFKVSVPPLGKFCAQPLGQSSYKHLFDVNAISRKLYLRLDINSQACCR